VARASGGKFGAARIIFTVHFGNGRTHGFQRLHRGFGGCRLVISDPPPVATGMV